MKKIAAIWMALLVLFSFPLALAEEVITVQGDATVDTTVTEDSTVESTDETVVEADSTVEAETTVETTTEVELADAGVTPDSALYVVDTVVDDLRLALTFDEAAKAELSVEIAEERLAETEEMVEAGDEEAAAEAQEQHDEALTTAEEAVEALESDGTTENAEESLETVAELQTVIEGHAAKVAAVHNAILARKAAQGWDPAKLARMEAVFAKIKAKAEATELKTKEKREKVKVKYKALAKLTDAELEEKLAEIDEKTGLAQERIARRAEQAKERLTQRVQQARQDTDDSTEQAEETVRGAKEKVVDRVKEVKQTTRGGY